MARLLPSLKSVVTQIIQWVSHHYCLVRSRPPFIPSVTSSSHPCPWASSSSLEEDITALPNSHTASQPACHYLLHTGSYSEASPSTLALAPALNPLGKSSHTWLRKPQPPAMLSGRLRLGLARLALSASHVALSGSHAVYCQLSVTLVILPSFPP